MTGKRLVLGRFGATDDLNLLETRDRVFGVRRDGATAAGSLLLRVLYQPLQLVFGDRWPHRPLVAFLAALFAFAARLSRSDRLHDARGSRLGTIG